MVSDQREMLPLFRTHIAGPGEVAHIDHVGFQHLPQTPVGLVGHHRGRQWPYFQFRETVRQEAKFP